MRRNRRQQGGAADGTERACAANGKWSRLGMMTNAFRLMKWLEFEPDEVYEAYKKKNAVKRQRIEEGY